MGGGWHSAILQSPVGADSISVLGAAGCWIVGFCDLGVPESEGSKEGPKIPMKQKSSIPNTEHSAAKEVTKTTRREACKICAGVHLCMSVVFMNVRMCAHASEAPVCLSIPYPENPIPLN